MPIIRFSDEYEALAELHGKSAQSLRDRDAGRDVYRLSCMTPEGRLVGSLTEYHRPDDRRFMRHVGDERASLVAFAQAELQAPVYVNVPNEAVATWEALGFEVEVAQEAFRLRFDAVLPRLRRATVPADFTLQAANVVDEERLFVLDNHVRNDMPGCDGWRGDRAMLHDELRDVPFFDPAGYLVGVHEPSGRYAGLIRVWRNPGEPRLGAIGVHRDFRSTRIGAALLRSGLEAAATWGSETFTSETSLSNGVIYPRLSRGVSLGTMHQMVRQP